MTTLIAIFFLGVCIGWTAHRRICKSKPKPRGKINIIVNNVTTK